MCGGDEVIESARFNERWSTALGYLLVALMMVCLAISAVQLGQQIYPEFQGAFIPWAALVIAVEAMYAHRVTHQYNTFSTEWLAYRIAEWILILGSLRLAPYLFIGFGTLRQDILLWQENFAANFLTLEYFLSVTVAMIVWVLSSSYASDLMELEGDVVILNTPDMDLEASNRPAIHRRMMSRFMAVGGVMIFLAGLMRIELFINRGLILPPRQGAQHVVIYFLLGLALLSLSRLAVLRGSWSFARVPVARGLTVRWWAYALVFLVIVTVIAVIVPRWNTFGLLASFGYLLDLVLALIYLLILILMLPFAFLLNLIARLFGSQGDVVPMEAPIPEEILPPPPTGEATSLPEIIKSILFWTIFISVLLFAIYQYSRENEMIKSALQQLRILPLLERLWGWLTGAWRSLTAGVSGVVQSGLRRMRPARTGASALGQWRYINLRRLSPRQKVMFYYLALIRRGSEVGLPRKPSQTPYEYSHSLTNDLPETDEDVSALTDAFVEARYSRHEINDERVGWVQRTGNVCEVRCAVSDGILITDN